TQPGGAPAPLPVRGAQETRPNPAEALPGIRPEDRPTVAEHAGSPPVPRVGAVRGTMGKPQLPRRRAQEHIVPQLRGGPAPRQENETPAGHDPGLMAAFQRGIGLAEAQQHLEATQAEPTATESMGGPHGVSLHDGLTGMAFTDMSVADGTGDQRPHASHATHLHGTHMDAPHMDAPHIEAAHVEAAHMGAGNLTADHTAPDHLASDRTTPDHMTPDHMSTGHSAPDHMAPTHLSRTHRDPADPQPASRPQSYSQALRPVHTSEFTARPDGSAPAG
ncbi:hypothetical protein ACFV23_46015, partial [Streptomyces sp. NPDC059627]